MTRTRAQRWIRNGLLAGALALSVAPGRAQDTEPVDLSGMIVRWTKGATVRIEEQRETGLTVQKLENGVPTESHVADGQRIRAASTVLTRDADDGGKPLRQRVHVTSWEWSDTRTDTRSRLQPDTSLAGATLDVTGTTSAFEGRPPQLSRPESRQWIAARHLGTDTSHTRYTMLEFALPTEPVAVGATWALPAQRQKALVRSIAPQLLLDHAAWTAGKISSRLERVEGTGDDAVAHVTCTGRVPIVRVSVGGRRDAPRTAAVGSALTFEGRFSGPLRGGPAPWSVEWSLVTDARFDLPDGRFQHVSTSRDRWTIRDAGHRDTDTEAETDAPPAAGPRHDLGEMTARWTKGQPVRLLRTRSDRTTLRTRGLQGGGETAQTQVRAVRSTLVARADEVDAGGRPTSLRAVVEQFERTAGVENPGTPLPKDVSLTGAHVQLDGASPRLVRVGEAPPTDAATTWLERTFDAGHAEGAWRMLVPAAQPGRAVAVGEAVRLPANLRRAVFRAVSQSDTNWEVDFDRSAVSVTLERLEGQADDPIAVVAVRGRFPLIAVVRPSGRLPFGPDSSIRLEWRVRAPLDGDVTAATGKLTLDIDAALAQDGRSLRIEGRLVDEWTSRAVDAFPDAGDDADAPPVAPPLPDEPK